MAGVNMDVNLDNIIQELREKLEIENESKRDFVDIEKCFVEFKTELYMKRAEVKQNRIDLELAKTELSELKRELDKLNKHNDEKQFSLNILTKKSKNLEEELFEKRDFLLKIQMQYKMTEGELDALKGKLQKTEYENNNLLKKNEYLETKQKHNSIYHSEVLKRENTLRNQIKEINTVILKLKSEQHGVNDLTKTSQLAGETIGQLKSIQKNYEDIKKEKDKIEELYIKTKGKCDKLEEYISASNQNIFQPNLITKVIFTQWKQNRLSFEKNMTEKNEILSNLCEAYEKEKSANVKLILISEKLRNKNKSLTEKNRALEGKIKELQEESKQEVLTMENDTTEGDVIIESTVKVETIEIPDE